VVLGETLGTSLLAPLVLATVEPKLKNELGNQPSPGQGVENQFVWYQFG